MRVRLKLESGLERMEIPINYNGEVSRFVYELLQPDLPFSAKTSREKRTGSDLIEYYTFSNLFIPLVEQDGAYLHFGNVPLELTLSMLVPEGREPEVLKRLAGEVPLVFSDRYSDGLRVTQVQVLANPTAFSRRVRFRMASPMASPVDTDRGSSAHLSRARDPQVIHYSSPDFSEAIREVLIARYVKCYGTEPTDTEFQLLLDQRYLQRRRGRISKLVTLDEGLENERRVKAIIAPFECEGNPELIALGYVAGFGERTLLGFGCVEMVNEPPPVIRTMNFPLSRAESPVLEPKKRVLHFPPSTDPSARIAVGYSIEGS